MNVQLRYYHQEKASTRPLGFSLVEMLVAMAIFAVLAITLTVFMNSTVETFELNTARKDAYSTATAIFNQLETDLIQAYLAPADRNPELDVRFRAELDNIGNTKLAFVSMSANPAISMGVKTNSTSTADIGLREIGWYINSSAGFPYTLCRVERLGTGGEDSFIDNVTENNSASPAFATSVGYFSIRFIPDSSSLTDEGISLDSTTLAEGYTTWDSTRGKLNDFELFVDQDSANQPWDDILPARVIITLTIIPDSGMRAFLTEELDANNTQVKVDNTNGFPPAESTIESFIFIDTEWMLFDSVNDDGYVLQMRGARGTQATPHKLSSPVRAGYSFVRTLVIPCSGKAIR